MNNILIQLRLSPELKKKIKEKSIKEGETCLSTYIRKLIVRNLEEE